jgi:predicted metalloprotease with PDZ domain
MIRVSCALALLFTLGIPVAAQNSEQAGPSYVLSFPKPQTHMFEVEMTIGNVRTSQLDLQMPPWTPGSYLQREFEHNVQDFRAEDANRPLTWEKVNKATWRGSCDPPSR